MAFWSKKRERVHEALHVLHKLKEEERITAQLIAKADAIAANLDRKLQSGEYEHNDELERAIEHTVELAEKDSEGTIHFLTALIHRLDAENQAAEAKKRRRVA